VSRDWQLRLAGMPIVYANTEQLYLIVENRTAAAFVWPEEGAFFDELWHFNEQHVEFAPLIVDIQTANLLITLRAALTWDRNALKFDRMIQANRASFARIVEYCWTKAKWS